MTNEAAFYNDAAVQRAFSEYDRTGSFLDLEPRLHDAAERMFGLSAGRKLVSGIIHHEARRAYDAADRGQRRAESGYCE